MPCWASVANVFRNLGRGNLGHVATTRNDLAIRPLERRVAKGIRACTLGTVSYASRFNRSYVTYERLLRPPNSVPTARGKVSAVVACGDLEACDINWGRRPGGVPHRRPPKRVLWGRPFLGRAGLSLSP